MTELIVISRPISDRNSADFSTIKSEPGSPRKLSAVELTSLSNEFPGQNEGPLQMEVGNYSTKTALRKRHSSAAVNPPSSAGGISTPRPHYENPSARRNVFNFEDLQTVIQNASDTPVPTPRRKHSSGGEVLRRCATADKHQIKVCRAKFYLI